MTPPARPAREFALLGLLALLWGSSYLFIKVAVTEIPPVSLIAFRVTIAAVMLVGLVSWRRLRWPSAAADWRGLMLQSVFNSIGA